MVSNHLFDLKNPPLVCRPALPGDTADVLELTRTIWDGHDYVPQVWQDWLADPDGLLAVAEAGGRVLGLGKLSLLDPGRWWLEGLRVHPEHQGKGIASHLHDYFLNYWLRTGAGSLRLATASFRLSVQHLCERTGFEKIADFSTFRADPLAAVRSGLTPLAPEEAGQALEVALQSETLRLSAGLMDLIWQWSEPTARRIQEAARIGRAWWWNGQEGLLVVGDDLEDGELRPYIQLVAGQVSRLPEMLRAYRALVNELGYAAAYWLAPLDPGLLPRLEQAGFQRDWDYSVFVYTKTHPGA